MNSVRINKFMPLGRVLASCLGLLPFAVAHASAVDESRKNSASLHTSDGMENACWKSHVVEIQEKIHPFVAHQDSWSWQITLKSRSLIREAMEKQGITNKLAKSKPTGEGSIAQHKGEKKAALEKIRALEPQIRKDPGLQKLVDGLRRVERFVDFAVSEIMKKDSACAGLDRDRTRGIWC